MVVKLRRCHRRLSQQMVASIRHLHNCGLFPTLPLVMIIGINLAMTMSAPMCPRRHHGLADTRLMVGSSTPLPLFLPHSRQILCLPPLHILVDLIKIYVVWIDFFLCLDCFGGVRVRLPQSFVAVIVHTASVRVRRYRADTL